MIGKKIKPTKMKSDGQHFCITNPKPAIKIISAFSNLVEMQFEIYFISKVKYI